MLFILKLIEMIPHKSDHLCGIFINTPQDYFLIESIFYRLY